MTTYEQIKRKVARLTSGRFITYDDFKEFNRKSPQALAKALQRLVEEGLLVRQQKGVFFKMKKTRFGDLDPTDNKLVNNLLIKNGKYKGYLSGLSVYLLFRISTQVPNTTTIATPDSKKNIKNKNIKYIKSYVNKINNDNIIYLQMLDALRFIKKAQDTTPDKIISRMAEIINQLEAKEINQLTRYALHYRPSTRALLGAIIEEQGYKQLASALKETLNPNSNYLINISDDILPNKYDWRIR